MSAMFWEDVLVAGIGALLTVAIALATYRLSVWERERRALNSLIDELHRRRAVYPLRQARLVRRAKRSDDFSRVNSSVLSMKSEIKQAREQSRSRPAVQRPLGSMTAACNHYLEASALRPDAYLFFAEDLRKALDFQLDVLRRRRRGLLDKEVGVGAYHSRAPEERRLHQAR